MRILYILEYYYPHVGGVETLFKSLAEQIVKEGKKATVITQRYDKSLQRKEEINGVTIIRLPISSRYLFTILAIFPSIWHALSHDIIHTTSYNAGIPSFVAGLVSRRKVIITFHEVWGSLWHRLPFFSRWSLQGHYYFEQLLLKIPFFHYIAVSEFTKKRLIASGIPSDKVTRIYNGLDYSEFSNQENKTINTVDKTEFLYYGRLGISKGIDILLCGAGLLQKKRQDFRVSLIIPKEPGGLLAQVKEMIMQLNLSKLVTIDHSLPWTALLSRIQDADVICIPSYSEGFGYTAAESVAMNIPIISSQNGALAEVISGKYIEIAPFDASGMSLAMEKALDGEFQKKEVRQFLLSETIKYYNLLYDRIKDNA